MARCEDSWLSDPQTDEFNVVYGSVAANDKEIAMLTRSVIEILTDLSSYIDVPPANVEQKPRFHPLRRNWRTVFQSRRSYGFSVPRKDLTMPLPRGAHGQDLRVPDR